MRRLFPFILLFVFHAAGVAAPLTSIYVPNAYVTLNGGDNGQSVQALQTLDGTGLSDSASCVQFYSKTAGSAYMGYRSYFITQNSSVTALQVLANFRGPSSDKQVWTWKIYDWVFNDWVPLGTNAMAFDHGPWTVLNFKIGSPFHHYINAATGELRIGCSSNNSADDASLNYEAAVVTTDSAAPSPGPAYFVSNLGNDAHPGTHDLPWRTISFAAKTVPPGSTVYVRGGIYQERVVFKVSGSAQAGPITFMGYPGELAIIDGTNVKIPAPPGAGPSGLVQMTNVNYLIFQGFDIRNVISNSSRLFTAGIGIEGKCDHLEIRLNHIHNISNGSYGANGVGVYGTAAPVGITNLIIDGNEIDHLTLGSSEALTLNGNVQYWTVSNNIVHDANNIGIDAIGFEATAPTGYDQARNGKICGNLVYNNSDNNNPFYPKNDNSADGIYVDGGTSIVIDSNIVHHNNIGIEVASEHRGKTSSYVIVRNNLIYQNTGPGISLGGYSKTVGSTDHCTTLNNTLYNNDTMKTGSGEIQLQYFPGTVSGNLLENNIVFANSQNLLISSPFSGTAVKLDYNVYYTPGGASPEWQWNNQSYSSLASFRKACGSDASSFFADPQFVNPLGSIFYLQQISPALNSGQDLGSDAEGSSDLSGHTRIQNGHIDRGAYEQ